MRRGGCVPRRIGDARQPLLLPSGTVSGTDMDEKVLIRPARHMSGIMQGYSVRDSYLRRDPRVSQHTLDGQMAALRVVTNVEIDRCANRKGAPVGIVRRCDFWRGNRPNSHGRGATGH